MINNGINLLMRFNITLWVFLFVHFNFANPRIINLNKLNESSLPFEDCGSSFDIKSISISSCSNLPCAMSRGSVVRVVVSFNKLGQSEDDPIQILIHRVRWVFNAVQTRALISPDPCESGLGCIFNMNDEKEYVAYISVGEKLPTLQGSIVWEASTGKNESAICFRIPVKIKT